MLLEGEFGIKKKDGSHAHKKTAIPILCLVRHGHVLKQESGPILFDTHMKIVSIWVIKFY
jgi:hypothetical protein